MPTPSTFAAFAAASLALVIMPGPNVLYILARGISQGRVAALISSVGVEAGVCVHVLAAALGLSALIATSAIAFNLVRYAGGAYLLYLGVKTLTTGREGPRPDVASPARSRSRLFRQGLLISALNPKLALFFLALMPQFVDPYRGSATQQVLLLGLVFVAIALVLDSAYALTSGSLAAVLRRRPALARRQGYFSGGVYVALGLFAVLAPGEQASQQTGPG